MLGEDECGRERRARKERVGKKIARNARRMKDGMGVMLVSNAHVEGVPCVHCQSHRSDKFELKLSIVCDVRVRQSDSSLSKA